MGNWENEVKKEVAKLRELVQTGGVVTSGHIEHLVSLTQNDVEVNAPGVVHEEHRPTTDVDAIQHDANVVHEGGVEEVSQQADANQQQGAASQGSEDPDAGVAERHDDEPERSAEQGSTADTQKDLSNS